MKPIIWDKEALEALEKIYEYISEDSVQNANKVLDGIRKKTRELSIKPEKYPTDKYKSDNSGNFRAFELYRIRIAYYIGKKEIRIVRIRSTYQEPLDY
ncbi:MAG: type II toxin-antitoxin system RelE/ParE family toxin [Chitinophagales bacterium]